METESINVDELAKERDMLQDLLIRAVDVMPLMAAQRFTSQVTDEQDKVMRKAFVAERTRRKEKEERR